jgi:hypothetical protein
MKKGLPSKSKIYYRFNPSNREASMLRGHGKAAAAWHGLSEFRLKMQMSCHKRNLRRGSTGGSPMATD